MQLTIEKVCIMASVFDEFVNRKTHKADPIDWTVRRENWLTKLSELHKLVKNYLNDFIKAEKIQISLDKIVLNEEHIGTYEADALTIVIGDSKVELRPKGTLLLGGIGRADLIGRRAEIMFVLAPKEAAAPRMRILTSDEARDDKETELDWNEWVWKIAIRQPTLRYIDLNKESFQDALMTAAS